MKSVLLAFALAGLAAACAPSRQTYAQATSGTVHAGTAKVEVCIEHNDVKTVRLLQSSGDPKFDEASMQRLGKTRIEGPDGCRPVDVEWRRDIAYSR